MNTSLRTVARRFETGKHRRVLSTQRIIFLVVAAAAPLAAMVGNLPIALARGNGAGVPAAFLFATLTLFLFAVGYAAISRRIVSTGSFFTYVAQGLGREMGVAAAFVALVAYLGVTIGMAAFFGYFLNLALAGAGVQISWIVFAFTGIAIVAFLGYRSIDLSSRILGLLMAIEILVLAVFDAAVMAERGVQAFPLESFSTATMFSPGFGVALMFAFTSFIGFESAALYGEEAHDPKRSIPAATYAAVILIGVFYLFTAWMTVGAIGTTGTAAAARSGGSMLMFVLFAKFCGQTLSNVAALLVCTSILASYLAIHNGAARYIFALSREKLLPEILGRFHSARYAPSNASLLVSAMAVLCVGGFAALRMDPYQAGVPVLIGVGTLGIILLQALAAIAITVYFARRKANAGVLLASALGAVGLVIATALVAINFPLLAAVPLPFVAWLPALYAVAMIAGIGFAQWLKANRRARYDVLAAAEFRSENTRPMPAPVAFDKPWCIVGAGPCGLLAARAFRLAGIPYEQFERHSELGGIWDIENPGTSMYESAHFISSKFTSAFFGMPMPDDYPDYPDHRRILDYIRAFAARFGLRDGITFGTDVRHAEPLGENARDGWRVTLSNGETRDYRGIVCANGVTWHKSMPDYPGLADFRGTVLHSVDYRDADLFRGKRVLIVGAGNSGVDIACDAARAADAAFISVRRGYRFVPKHIFGVPTDVFLLGNVHPPKGVVIPDDASRMLDAVVGDLTRYGLPAPDHKALESHPIMNTQILHHLAHGDLTAKRDVTRFTPDGAVFADGSTERFDLVLFATGYEYRIPYLDPALFTWRQGRPDLYLNIFHRTLQGLSVVGFVEFASAGYQRFDEMAQMSAMDAWLTQSGRDGEWLRLKREDRPNLRGTKHYVDSPRHANYVDVDVYRRVLSELRERFGWPDPDDDLYRPLDRQAPASPLSAAR
jgi:cation diffusion facilitator CzcD-associated flavoprotein CzcO/amino acid transporter